MTTDSDLLGELERMRERLLDMSARNPLLAYRHPRTRSLRIVDEIPSSVFDGLIGGASFRFAPLVEPTAATDTSNHKKSSRKTASETLSVPRQGMFLANRGEVLPTKTARANRETALRELAIRIGVNPDFDLLPTQVATKASHKDKELQTLLSPGELEGHLQKIRSLAATCIQESGANTLHLMFGFVEWTDTPGGSPRMAPLVLLPVALTRQDLDDKTHTFRYTIAADGEDWSTNVTLIEKAKREFGFVLPPIDPEEALEEYFSRLEAVLVATGLGWRIRRHLTLGLVSFGKTLMWRDLDPVRWGGADAILSNPLFRRILGEEEALPVGDGPSGCGEYDIDSLPAGYGPLPSIVVEADSSQHSVLVDIQRGKNLVVQGPPGTGKSQTITNIIAAAIGSGKKILFVAEKKAALDVVARRLAEAGLGPYCLPLHSHTSDKKGFLNGLDARLNLNDVPDVGSRLSSTQSDLDEVRSVLTKHAETLNSRFGAMGDTVFSILWRSRRLESDIHPRIVAALEGFSVPDAAAITPSVSSIQGDILDNFASAYKSLMRDLPSGEPHPWSGVTHGDLGIDGTADLIRLAQAAHRDVGSADASIKGIVMMIPDGGWPSKPVAIEAVMETLAEMPVPKNDATVEQFDSIAHVGYPAARDAVVAFEKAAQAWEAVPDVWRTREGMSRDELEDIGQVLERAAAAFNPHWSIEKMRDAITTMEGAQDHLSAAGDLAERMLVALGVECPVPAPLLSCLIGVGAGVGNFPVEALALRTLVRAIPDLRAKVEKLILQARTLREEATGVEALFPFGDWPSVDGIRGALRTIAAAPSVFPSLFSKEYRKIASQYRRLSGSRASKVVMQINLIKLGRYLRSLDSFSSDTVLSLLFGATNTGVEAPLEGVLEMLEWEENSCRLLEGKGEAGRLLGEAVLNSSSDAWKAVASAVSLSRSGVGATASLEATLADVTDLLRMSVAEVGTFAWQGLQERVRRLLNVARAFVSLGDTLAVNGSLTISDASSALESLLFARGANEALAQYGGCLERLGLPNAPVLAIEGNNAVSPEIKEAMVCFGYIWLQNLPIMVKERLSEEGSTSLAVALRTNAADALGHLSSMVASESAFMTAAGTTSERWYRGDADAPLSARLQRFQMALDLSGSLTRYATYLRSRQRVAKSPVSAVCDLLECAVISPEDLLNTYTYLLYRTMARLVLHKHPSLETFSGALHERARARFNSLDKEYIQLMRKATAKYASQAQRYPGNGYTAVKKLSDEGLIRHEITKVRRQVAIREMFRRAGRAIQALKPCFMMGPQAVAQYLEPGKFHFDLVIMDEASQMRPQDALGAIARGSRLVVVGDPHQLGPTSFFQGQDEEEDAEEIMASHVERTSDGKTDVAATPEAEVTVLQRSESILAAASLCFPVRMLRWHYRSRYPELITFSNHRFYGGDLVLFPHPGVERPGDKVNFHLTPDAVYEGHVNQAEASAIVEAVRRHAHECPERSLLVATMNQAQSELIATCVQEAEKEDPMLSSFLSRHADTPEPFDVSNLESIQGHERDVVIVSITYGKNQYGKLAQNFGPVNTIGGERRLNVLFTRAKYRLDIFCSFDPADLHLTESVGLTVLRDFLRYAKDGVIAGGSATRREPDSDFEISVARAVRAHGYDVHPQVGAAGYFLDMAVVNPRHPGSYVLGIECDGATYHSARSARDRDRLRQSILEGLGWNIYRVWSTDWFRDPDGETVALVKRLKSLSSPDNVDLA